MDNIKKIIIILVILIIFVLGVLLFVLKKYNNEEEYNESIEYLEDGGEIIPEADDEGFVDVEDDSIFFSVFNSVERYIYITQYNILDLDENQYDKEGNHVDFDVTKLYLLDIKNENDRLQALYDLLDRNYIDNNQIFLNNIKQYVSDIDVNTELIPISMKVKYGDNVNTFILNAYLKNDKLVQKKFIVRVNNKNETFSIEFKNDDSRIVENESDIQKNSFNNFEIEDMTDEKSILKYLEYFKKITLDYPQIAYENYFDDEYKEKRFGSLENYIRYINDNLEELEYSQIIKYFSDNTTDGNIYYVGIDQYENTYIFTTFASMKFKLKLDNYTIPTDTFKEEYKSAEAEKKVQMNIDKFIQMINRHDYITSYNCLADSFKNNYFNTQEEFENYIKNNFFGHNKLAFKDFEEKGNNIYTCTIQLTDLTGENLETRELTIIMKLNYNLDFEMSFGIE